MDLLLIFDDVSASATLATIGITLFLAMTLSYMTASGSDYISAIIFSGIIIWAVIWVIAIILWAIVWYVFPFIILNA